MSKIDLYSSDWCELIFEGRNKSYGAYEMRSQTERRHRYAIILVAVIFAGIVLIPKLVKMVVPERQEQITEVTALIDIKVEPIEQKKERPLDLPRPVEAPPAVKTSIKNTTVQILEDSQVPEDETGLKTQTTLIESTSAISVADVIGDPDAEKYADELEASQITDLGFNEYEEPMLVVDVMPTFPGGAAKWSEFIDKNLEYPDRARDNNVEGRVTITFIVETDGSLTDIAVARPVDPDLDREALRVIRLSPKWNPGEHMGVARRVRFQMPILFRLAAARR